MGTMVRSEVSKRKEYWLPKHRHLELVHFCLQYPEWRSQLKSMDGYSGRTYFSDVFSARSRHVSNPVERIVEKRLELEERIDMVDRAAKEAAFDLSDYVVRGVTEGIGYDALNVPCCKDVYYQLYRRFFWLLDKARK